MPVAFIKKSTGWTQIKKMYLKKNGSWTALATAYLKKNGAWTKVFAGSGPSLNSAPTITPRLGGKLFDTYDSTNGSWDGATTYTRQWSRSDNETGPFENITGATSTSYKTVSTASSDDDGKWITVTVRASDGTNFNEAAAKAVKITKYKPVALIVPAISGTVAEDSTVTALTTLGTYWKNTTDNTGDTAPNDFTYRWYWGDTTGDDLGSSSTYTIQSTDVGHTLRVDVTATNTGGETTSTSNQTATVGQPIGISNVVFEDENGDSGFNNRDNLVTATYLTLKFKVSGVNSSTTFRVRYRVLNNQTGAYWSPSTETATTASAAWLSYESDYNNVGTISNVTISGGDAFVSDTFVIPEIFNGSTYSGGIARWTWEYDISAVIGGNRYYWVPGDTVSRSFTYDWWDIDPTTNPTISPSSANRTTSTSVTFTGTLASYPASLSAYTRAYKMVYGDGTDSGWFYPGYGASNTTYSFTKTYSTEGTYYPYITAIPYYAIASSTITVFDPKTRTLYFDANSGTGAPSSQSGTDNGSGVAITISATKPTRTGYSFSKWNTNSSGTGTDYNPSGSITLTSDVTLYAVWTEAANYTITYDGNTNNSGSTAATVGSGSVSLASNGFAKDYCNFGGWNTKSDGTGTNYTAGDSYNLTANVTLYAKWTARTVTAAAPSNFVFVGNITSNTQKRWSWSAQENVTNGTFVSYRWQLTTTNPNVAGWNGDFTEGTQAALSRTINVSNASGNPRWMRVCVNARNGLGELKNGSFTIWK